MAFAPRNKNNAIAEVAFVISLAGKPDVHLIEKFSESHASEWSEEFPIKDEVRGQKLQLGPDMSVGPQILESTLDGALFRTLQRDGSLDWQVAIEGSLLKVNCGSYSRWANVWPTARGYLNRLCKQFVSSSTPVTSVALQYVDEFVWTSSEDTYDATTLFKRESEYFLPRMCSAGHLWHLHLGWFEKHNLPAEGRRLERVHIDAIEEAPIKRLATRIDITLRHDFSKRLNDQVQLFGTRSEGVLDKMFETMHVRNKEMMKSLMTSQMADRIGLND